MAIVAGVLHAAVNWKPLAAHLRPRWWLMLGVLLLGVMAVLLVDGLTRPLDAEAIRKIEGILTVAREQSTPTH